MKEDKGVVRDSRQGHDTPRPETTSSLLFPVDSVEIWRVQLDEPAKASAEFGVLSADEIARAGRFHFERDRNHFSLCRSALRRILAGYLAIPPANIRFEYTASGKPQLAADQNSRALQFNVSHSAGIALIAVASERRIGVDIEKIRNDVDTTALAERFFSVRERTGLRSLPEALRRIGFYACWTRKEAFLKATGDGLSFPLADFTVTVHPDEVPTIAEERQALGDLAKWWIRDLSAPEGYRAALVVEGGPCMLRDHDGEAIITSDVL